MVAFSQNTSMRRWLGRLSTSCQIGAGEPVAPLSKADEATDGVLDAV